VSPAESKPIAAETAASTESALKNLKKSLAMPDTIDKKERDWQY
jgi:hypothetical protein